MRHAEIRVSGMRRHLLMPEGNVFDSQAMTSIDQSVVSVPTLAKDLLDALLLQTLRDEQRSGHSFRSP
jgi:hypothetical protein